MPAILKKKKKGWDHSLYIEQVVTEAAKDSKESCGVLKNT